jgi:hypothetical protein
MRDVIARLEDLQSLSHFLRNVLTVAARSRSPLFTRHSVGRWDRWDRHAGDRAKDPPIWVTARDVPGARRC